MHADNNVCVLNLIHELCRIPSIVRKFILNKRLNTLVSFYLQEKNNEKIEEEVRKKEEQS